MAAPTRWILTGVLMLAACVQKGTAPVVPADSGTDLGPTTEMDAEPDAEDVVTPPMDSAMDVPTDLAVDVPLNLCDALPDGNCLMCTPGQRVCNGICANPDDPTVGCADPSCTPCVFANATAVCGDAGRCAMGACNTGFTDCDHNPANGCETATGTDTNNCGTCGTACTAPPHATAGCAMGVCGVGTCTTGFGDCDMVVTNGCETPTTADPSNCGSCGNHCMLSEAMSNCAGGMCSIVSCGAGFGNCDGMASNGCEANLQTDANNCAMCGHACVIANGTPACTAGACAVGSCNAGFGDCDGNPANGCETNLATAPAHCGACNTPCTYLNAQGTCAASTCSLGACNTGFQDCAMSGTACGTHTSVDPNNCGTCGTVCSLNNAVAGCAAGSCTVAMCATGSADCDHAAANGCEVDTNGSVANCGGCAHACALANAEPECDTGVCQIAACLPDFRDCNGSPVDGCEINTSTNVSHCGDCDTVCSFPHAAASCTASECTLGACASGYADCDGDPGTGCESFLATDPNNCGSCNNRCVSGTCTGGHCV